MSDRGPASRLGRILEHAPAEIYVFEADTLRLTHVNRTARRNLGYDVDEIAGMSLADVSPLFEPVSFARVADALRAGRLDSVSFEGLVRRKDGSCYPVDVRLELADEDQPPVFIAVAQDASARKRAEEERAQLLREQAARAVAEAAGRRAAFLADATARLSASLDVDAAAGALARLVVAELADWCAVDVLEVHGGVRRVALAHKDPAGAALVPSIAAVCPPTASHPAVARYVLGEGRSVLVADLAGLEPLPVASPLEGALMTTLGARSVMIVPLRARERTVGAITFLLVGDERRYDAGDLRLADELGRRAALAIENARLFEQLQEADRRKDRFLAVLGHELRNPLAAISAAGQVLGALDLGDPRARRQQAIIARQAQHLSRLVDDLLDVARITSGKVVLQRRRVELTAVVARAVEATRAALETRRHRLTLEVPADGLPVDADPVRLEQVLVNLLDNAIKYTPAGGRIDVSAARDGHEAVIAVRDDGIGIAVVEVPRVFDAVAGTQPRVGAQGAGLGLGLRLVRALVEQHGGSVTAESQGPGQGSRFVVRLPLASGDGDAAVEPAPVRSRTRGRHVLVVDDNPDGRDALRALLELWGHRVDEAATGPDGVATALAGSPEVALIDIGLPGFDGHEVARRLRATPAGGGIYLIALTGYGQPEDRDRALAAGFDTHVVKPVDPETLRRLVEEQPREGAQAGRSTPSS